MTGNCNTLALVRPQPLYILSRVKQGPVFLVNSRPGNFRCAPHTACTVFDKLARSAVQAVCGEGISRSYACFFAEFLSEVSPVHLGILYQPTCVGLQYGSIPLYFGAFLGRVLTWILFPEGNNFSNTWISPYVGNKNPITCPSYYSSSLRKTRYRGPEY